MQIFRLYYYTNINIYDFRIKRCSVRLYLKLFEEELMSYLCYLCCYTYCGVQHNIVLCFAFLRLVYPMLPVSLDCPILITPSTFSKRLFVGYQLRFSSLNID